MAGTKINGQHERLGRDRYRRIQLGIRRTSRPETGKKPAFRRNIFFMIVFCTLSIFAIKTITAHPTYAVVIDGATVGVTDDPELCKTIIAGLCESEAMRVGAEVVVTSTVAFEPNKDKKAEVYTEDDIAAALRESITLLARGYVITVNGQEIVALASEEEARGVVSDLRAVYIQTIMSSDNATVEDVFIREEVGIVDQEVPVDKFRSREEAVLILSRGTDKILNYVVRRGDSLWAIAEANHLSVDALIQANPEVGNGSLIHEGQNINLVVADPYVTVASTETVTYTVSIPYTVQVTEDPEMWPWQETVSQAGKSGQKEITQKITRENGKEVSRINVGERILSTPVVRKIVRGSKQVPTMGSGDLAWPVQGTITSYYGPRWGRMHQGVDIGASTGTSIVAADSGMVTYAGWNGGYGNFVKIDHGDGMETCYGHLSKFAVKTGDTVSKGDVIGYVGSTGNSNGPHLHFEVREGGAAKNPLDYYK